MLCPAGHPSPPHAGTCRSCGRDIPPQQPFQTPRPPLGVLRLASGDVVQLDRGVLLGRSPKVNAELPAADRPHLVRVAQPQNDISRNHVEVVLEGWHVLIRDLGSTNGTTVALPGQDAVRLRPSDQQVIEPGTVITLADEVSVTYEVRRVSTLDPAARDPGPGLRPAASARAATPTSSSTSSRCRGCRSRSRCSRARG